jgi:hypothetical protein
MGTSGKLLFGVGLMIAVRFSVWMISERFFDYLYRGGAEANHRTLGLFSKDIPLPAARKLQRKY